MHADSRCEPSWQLDGEHHGRVGHRHAGRPQLPAGHTGAPAAPSTRTAPPAAAAPITKHPNQLSCCTDGRADQIVTAIQRRGRRARQFSNIHGATPSTSGPAGAATLRCQDEDQGSAMFNGHRRRNDLLSAQIGQLCAGFGQVRHASAAAHSGGYASTKNTSRSRSVTWPSRSRSAAKASWADACGDSEIVARSPRTVTPGRQAERFGTGPAVVLGQDVAEAAGPVRDGAAADLWQRVTGRWVTVTGKRRELDLLITSMMPVHELDLASATLMPSGRSRRCT